MRLVLSCLVSLAVAWPSVISATAQDTTPAAALRSKAEQILDRSAELSALWPGYWPATQGFVLYEPAHGAILVGANDQPATISYQAGLLPDADAAFVFDYPAGSPNMMLVTVQNDWRASITTLFHEQFHDFQSDTFDKADLRHGGENVDLTAIPDRAAFTAAAELERRVLADALMADGISERMNLTRLYIALRRQREASVGSTIVGKERYRERSEGTAQYIGLSAASLVIDGDTASVRDALVDGLRKDLIRAESTYVSNWFRWRAYDVGGAIAWLLDQTGEDWKSRVQSGEALDLVLEDYVGSTGSSENASMANAGREMYDADRLLAEVTQALAAAPPSLETREDFLALGHRRLILVVTTPLTRINEGRQFSKALGMTPLGRSALAFPNAERFQLEKPGITMRLENLSVMMETPDIQQDQHVQQVYTVLLTDSIQLASLTTLGPGEHSLDSLLFDHPSLSLTIEGPVKVTIADEQIMVQSVVADLPTDGINP